MKDNAIAEKSKAFALRIIKLYKYLSGTQKEFVLSKQVLRSGTSIGANIREAQRGQSKADFYAKLYISLESLYLADDQFGSIYNDCEELIRLLVAITATQKTTPSNS